MARVLVLDVISRKGLYEAKCNELADFYRELQCDCFDIATRKIGDKYFDLFVDDVGLFAERPIPSVLDKDFTPMLVGNVVIANHDSNGNTTSLSDDDVELIKNHVITLMSYDSSPTDIDCWEVICPADY